jgi:hypothetical protein
MQTQSSVGDVRAFFENAYPEVLAYNGVEGMHHSENFHVGGNSGVTARELHSPLGSWLDHARPMSELSTDQNLRY